MHIKTKRIVIQEFTERDLDAFAHLVADPEVMRFSLKGPLSFDEAKEHLDRRIFSHYQKHGFGLWALFVEEQLIGLAGLINQSIDGIEEVELAYRLHPDFWGKGYALEAVSAISEYAFSHLNLPYLISIIDPKNHPSVKIATRLGMHFWKQTIFHGFDVGIHRLLKVLVEPYNDLWPSWFEEEKKKIPLELQMFHIGSTSIPGCSAKPIIDMLGTCADITEIDDHNQAMEKSGYEPMGENGIPQRRFFRKRANPPVNLHIFEVSDPEAARHLRFRNYLRAHPEHVERYSRLKKDLATRFPHDILNYIRGKGEFVKSIDMAAAWDKQPIELQTSAKRKTLWSEQEILIAMRANMHLQMTLFSQFIPAVERLLELDVTVIQSSVADDTYNFALGASFTENNCRHRINHVRSQFRQKKLPFSWWVGGEDTPPQLGRILIEEGLALREENVGMVLDLKEFQAKGTDLQIERIGPKQLREFVQVLTTIGIHSDAHEKIYSQLPPLLYLEESPFAFYLAYRDKRPIATGLLVLHAQVAGIYYITTIPEERKKGVGTAMMQQLLAHAQSKGYALSTLQASHLGKNLYEKMGYRSICSFKEYVLRQSS